MSKQFSPKLIFRLLPPALLNTYFTARQQPQFQVAAEAPDIEHLYQLWESLSPESRNPMEAELRDVHEMADSDTDLATVLQEAEYHGVAEALRHAFADLGSLEERMLFTLLKYPRVFEVARIFERTDHLNGKCWRKRIGLPKQEPRTSPEACQALAGALKDYYMNHEGRGRGCHVEPLKRGTDIYFYVYLEDYARTGVTFDNHGQYQRQALKDSFEIIFRYDPVEGSLDTFVKGQRRLVEDIQTIFARVCLDADLPPQPRATPLYNFNGLLRRQVFPTNPADGIRQVRVKSLKLFILGSKRRILVEEGDAENLDGVYDLLDTITADESRGRQGLHRALLNVTRAEFQLVFRQETGRDKKLTFAISYPNGCTLKGDRREDQIARAYLKRWGIELHGTPADTQEPALTG